MTLLGFTTESSDKINCVLVHSFEGIHISVVKFIICSSILLALGSIGCTHSGSATIKEISLEENVILESWRNNQLSTYEYLSASIALAHEKSVVHFKRHKALLTRYPKWVSGLHPRPDTKLRSTLVESYRTGRINAEEYEELTEQVAGLLDRWGDQRRVLTQERFRLGYHR